MSKKTNAMRLLEAAGIPYELVEYTYDSEDLSVAHIAEANGLPLESIYKTLAAKGDKNGLAVAVIPGHKNLGLKALRKASGNRKATLVPVREIQALTGYIRGGCSPVGMKKDYPVWLDISALAHDKIFVNAGQRGLLMGLSPEGLLQAAHATAAPITA